MALTMLLAAPAFAQQSDPAETAYVEGRKAYDLRDWDKAIASFKEAYRLRPDAKSLFNIAQSYRLKGDCSEAIGFYKTYKRNFPTAPNITIVDKFLVDLEPCAKAQTTQPATPPAEPAPPVASQPIESSAPVPQTVRIVDAGRSKRVAGLAIAGGGVALVATGFIFGAIAAGKADDITNGGDPQSPPVFDPDVEASGERFDTLAKVFWGVGGAAIIGGSVMYMLGRRATSTQVTVVPQQGGAVVTWGGSL